MVSFSEKIKLCEETIYTSNLKRFGQVCIKRRRFGNDVFVRFYLLYFPLSMWILQEEFEIMQI